MLGSYTGLGGAMITRPLTNIYFAIPGVAANGASISGLLGSASGSVVSTMTSAGILANSATSVPSKLKGGGRLD
jgi:hypothetical protein